MDSTNSFEELEKKHHEKFDNIELSFEPKLVLNVTLVSFRNISVSPSHDVVDTPDPQFRVTCPKVKNEKMRSFATHNITNDTTSGKINETFKFIVPNDLNPEEHFPVIFELYDLDVVFDDFIAKHVINAASLVVNGEALSRTIHFDNNTGELDVILKKELKNSPDFRHSLGLSDHETYFRKKRIPFVYEALNKILNGQGPQNLKDTPIVSLVCSGGGYRAVIGMCGAMEALRDAGLLDTITYTSGLSGSAWYLSSAYALEGISSEKLDSFHEGLREKMEKNLIWDLVNPFTLLEYENYRRCSYKKHDQPHTLANYFPGFIVGRHLLGEKSHLKLSELHDYVAKADVPFPIFVSIHVKNRIKAGHFHAYMERSPCEIYLPSYGIGLNAKQEGSSWNEGVLVRERPEFPLDFTIGMTGCAFSVLLNAYIKQGTEKSAKLLHFIDQERINGNENAWKSLDETGRAANIESDSEEEEVEDDPEETYSPSTRNNNLDGFSFPDKVTPLKSDFHTAEVEPRDTNSLHEKIRNNPLFSSREAFIGRTAKVNNFVLGLEHVKRFPLNPFGLTKIFEGQAKELIDALGVEAKQKKISTKKSTLSFVDAGILKNVPTEAVLRPQRSTDVMIVMDFSDYGSDEHFDYMPLLSAAAHSWQSGLKFPNIDFEKITNLPPKELQVFPGDEDGCPTVLWFTLCNREFKNLKDYVPKSKEKPSWFNENNFNDFNVFGEDSFCHTFSFQYDKYEFDRLRELMYYNVSSHIEEIKEALIVATKNKRTRLAGK